MEAEDMTIGMKVRPLQRTIGGNLIKLAEHSLVYRQALSRGQKYLYVSRINFNGSYGVPRVMCSINDPTIPFCPPPNVGAMMMSPPDGDWFDDVDLVLYTGDTVIPFQESKEYRDIEARERLKAECTNPNQ